MHGANMKI